MRRRLIRRFSRQTGDFDEDRPRQRKRMTLLARLLFWLLVALTPLLALVSGASVLGVDAASNPVPRPFYQTSPLSAPAEPLNSPLIVTASTPAEAAANPPAALAGSSVSLYLVSMVLAGLLVVIAMVVWRRR